MTTNNTFSNQNREENNTFCKTNSQDLTEQWKNGELEKNKRYYIKDGEKIFTSYLDEYNVFLQSREDHYEEYDECSIYVDEVLAPVPSYEEWQPFTDPYFRGLTTKDIAELAKKSIRLTKQSCEDNTTIQRLKELLGYCADVLEELDDKDRDIEILLEEVNEVLA